jgi:hypothetical protein
LRLEIALVPESIESTFEQFKRVAEQKNITWLEEWQVGHSALGKSD